MIRAAGQGSQSGLQISSAKQSCRELQVGQTKAVVDGKTFAQELPCFVLNLGCKQALSGDIVGNAAQIGSSSHKLHCQVIILIKHGCPHILTPLLQEQLDSFEEDLQVCNKAGLEQQLLAQCSTLHNAP